MELSWSKDDSHGITDTCHGATSYGKERQSLMQLVERTVRIHPNDALSADTDWNRPEVSMLGIVEMTGGCRRNQERSDMMD